MSDELELAQQLEKFVDNLNQSDPANVQKIRADSQTELDSLFEMAVDFKAATSQMPAELSERASSAIFEKDFKIAILGQKQSELQFRAVTPLQWWAHPKYVCWHGQEAGAKLL